MIFNKSQINLKNIVLYTYCLCVLINIIPIHKHHFSGMLITHTRWDFPDNTSPPWFSTIISHWWVRPTANNLLIKFERRRPLSQTRRSGVLTSANKFIISPDEMRQQRTIIAIILRSPSSDVYLYKIWLKFVIDEAACGAFMFTICNSHSLIQQGV